VNSLIEQIRREAISDLFRLKGFGSQWEARRNFFVDKLSGSHKKSGVKNLANHLSEAFKLGASSGRSQGDLSMAGSTWEALVVWYLNLCLTGTRAVCVRGGALTPTPISDALSVCFENTVLRSEPDVVLYSSQALADAPAASNRKAMLEIASELIEDSFPKTGVINFQCKTNWNDNAQVPMLWNMLYNQARKGAVIPNGFSIGRNGHSLKNLGLFGYSFVTVPTQKKGPSGYKPHNLDVLRVKTMSAGNYWGHPTINGISLSLSELFNVFNRNSDVFPNVSVVGLRAAALIAAGDGSDQGISAYRLLRAV
jgi:hypothetical protein